MRSFAQDVAGVDRRQEALRAVQASYVQRTLWRIAAAAVLILLASTAIGADTNELDQLAQLQKRCRKLIEDEYKLAEAKPVVERLLALTLRLRGEEHQDTVVAWHWTGYLASKEGNYAEAQHLGERSLAMQETLPEKDMLWYTRTLHMLGRTCCHRYEFQRATDVLQRARVLSESALGTNHQETLGIRKTLDWHHQTQIAVHGTTNELVQLQRRSRKLIEDEYKLDEAKPVVERLLALTLEVRGEIHGDTVLALYWSAYLAAKAGNYPECERLSERSLAIQNKLPEKDPVSYQRTLRMLGRGDGQKPAFGTAESTAGPAREIREKTNETNREDLLPGPASAPAAPSIPEADEVVRLQRFCEKLIVAKSNLREAQPVAERLLAVTVEQRGDRHPDMVIALHWIAFLAQCAGRLDEAVRTWRQSLEIQDQLPEPDLLWYSRTLGMLGGVYLEQNDFSRAEEVLLKALTLREQALGSSSPDTASILQSLGRTYHRMRDLSRAEFFYLRALRVFEQNVAGGDGDLIRSLKCLGDLYADMGDLTNAELYMTRALALSEKEYGPEHTEMAGSFAQLAELFAIRSEHTRAFDFYSRSLRILEKRVGPEHMANTWPLIGMANVCEEIGQFLDAEAYLLRSRAIAENLGPQHANVAWVVARVGSFYESRGETARARDCFERACQMSSTRRGSSLRTALLCRTRLARVQFTLGETAAALAAVDEIQDGEEQELHDLLSFTSEPQRMALWKPSFLRDRFGLWATLGAVRPLARAVLRTKSLVLDSLLEDHRLADASRDPEIRRLMGELQPIKRRLAQWYCEERQPERLPGIAFPALVTDRDALTDQYESRQAALARKVMGLGQTRRALAVTMEQVQQAIPARGALVEFLRYPQYLGQGEWRDHYGVLIFAKHDEPKWVPLEEAKAIEKNLKLYQHLVRSKSGDVALEPLLRELYRQLWAPLSASLPVDARQIILCPDAQLNFLSFATLVSASNRFLAEDYEISYVSSGRDLLAVHPPATNAPDLLVWANPDFGSPASGPSAIEQTVPAGPGRSVREPRGLDFPPLPGAAMEGRWLHNHARDFGFVRATLHEGPGATEAELSRVQAPNTIHFATHGFVLAESNAAEADGIHQPRPETGNPMLRSGLALAGAKHTLEARAKGVNVPAGNDGIVTAEEISCLNLRGTRLVVLSACDTGSGEARVGEGVLGLRRGFIQAGAQNLLLTLWPIDDEQTSGLMLDFYRAAHGTGNPRGALAEAQRSWLKRLRLEKGAAAACRVAGPFILSSLGPP